MEAKRYIAAGIIMRDGKIFIAQRAKKDHLIGKWEFPGGKLEPEETLQECLKRELFEELGIHAEVGEHFCSVSFMLKETLWEMCTFKVTSFEGEITLNEHSDMAWVTVEEMANYDFPDPDVPIIKLLQNQT
jgi:mutator protein MutT